ncbi:MAG: hypothetical protein OK422_02695 [Thaumarchaeota archaeon]|nr:hypothetical protein [Nitrososphaerota archaeon]
MTRFQEKTPASMAVVETKESCEFSSLKQQFQSIGGSNQHGYGNWCAVAAYFDGDGSVFVSRKKFYNVTFVLEWSDNYSPQLVQLRDFFIANGIKTGEITQRRAENLYRLRISGRESIFNTARGMLLSMCTFKKRRELASVAEYLQGTVEGNEVLKVLNEEAEAGQRVSKKRYALDLPFTHSEGVAIARERMREGTRHSSKSRAVLTKRQVEDIRRAYEESGTPQSKLAQLCRVSRATIVRALGRERGHVATSD